MTRRAKKIFLKKAKCLCCGATKNITRDHVIPKVYGYTLHNNKQPLCQECNRNKGVLIIDYSKKVIELEPYMFTLMFTLNQKGVEKLFNDTYRFSCVLFDPNSKKKNKYFNEFR